MVLQMEAVCLENHSLLKVVAGSALRQCVLISQFYPVRAVLSPSFPDSWGAERKGSIPMSNVCPIHPRCFLDNCSLSTYVRDSFIPHVKLFMGFLACVSVCVSPALCRDNYAAQKPSLQMLQPQESPEAYPSSLQFSKSDIRTHCES